MSTSREEARDKLVSLFTTALVGDGLPVKTVQGHKADSLAGVTPLVTVLSAGSYRPRLTFQGCDAIFSFEVGIWVLQACDGWTNAQAEDAIDDIESRIAAVYESNPRPDEWELIDYDGKSIVTEASVDGVPHYFERIPTIAQLARS